MKQNSDNGYGSGYGSGYGYDDGSGYGYGSGYGSGDGDGDGSGRGSGRGSGYESGSGDGSVSKTEILIIDQNMDCLPLILGAIVTEEGQQYLEKILRGKDYTT